MKYYFFLIGLIFLFSSCSESDNKENNKDEVVVEKQMTLFEFNDLLVSRFDKAEVMMLEIWEMDNQDAPEEDIKAKAEEYLLEINIIIQECEKLNPIGEGGEAYLNAFKQHMNIYQNIFNVFIDYSYILSTPDDEWDQDMGSKWMTKAEPVFAEYEITIKNLEEQQSYFAVHNKLDIVP